jgi:hypothetical protein
VLVSRKIRGLRVGADPPAGTGRHGHGDWMQTDRRSIEGGDLLIPRLESTAASPLASVVGRATWGEARLLGARRRPPSMVKYIRPVVVDPGFGRGPWELRVLLRSQRGVRRSWRRPQRSGPCSHSDSPSLGRRQDTSGRVTPSLGCAAGAILVLSRGGGGERRATLAAVTCPGATAQPAGTPYHPALLHRERHPPARCKSAGPSSDAENPSTRESV